MDNNPKENRGITPSDKVPIIIGVGFVIFLVTVLLDKSSEVEIMDEFLKEKREFVLESPRLLRSSTSSCLRFS